MMEHPWYSKVQKEDDLNQGDIIFNCPILAPIHDISTGMIKANCYDANVIVMSQTCDIIQNKLELVLVCPFSRLTELESMNPWFIYPKNKEKLRQGNQPNYHLLNKFEAVDSLNDFIVVDFRAVFSIPYSFLQEFKGNLSPRIRLQSPYKEHLSQAFARFFMRVGLPVDIPAFK